METSLTEGKGYFIKWGLHYPKVGVEMVSSKLVIVIKVVLLGTRNPFNQHETQVF